MFTSLLGQENATDGGGSNTQPIRSAIYSQATKAENIKWKRPETNNLFCFSMFANERSVATLACFSYNVEELSLWSHKRIQRLGKRILLVPVLPSS